MVAENVNPDTADFVHSKSLGDDEKLPKTNSMNDSQRDKLLDPNAVKQGEQSKADDLPENSLENELEGQISVPAEQ